MHSRIDRIQCQKWGHRDSSQRFGTMFLTLVCAAVLGSTPVLGQPSSRPYPSAQHGGELHAQLLLSTGAKLHPLGSELVA